MPKIRDYKYPDLEGTIKLMRILSENLGIAFDEENWKRTAKYRAFNPEFRTLIAEKDGKIVGMCFADIQRDEMGRFHGVIRNVVIDPEYRREKIATKLITQAISLFVDLKVNTARVQLSEQIKGFMPLFEKLNFHRTSIVLETNVFKIREYKEADYEATKELMQMYSKLINIPFSEDEWKHTIRIRMQNPQYKILISEQEGVVTGMAFISIASDEIGLTIGYIENAIVHPKYRRLEIGKALLMRAVETLNVLQVDKIRVNIQLEAAKWLKYFEDVGFHTVANTMELKLMNPKD
ncbi:MAG: GNAT family N-acetyltransferase [Candidatus Helarchaeota archaeon]|nr:GNAT family N-acetyltransferase [Candidatus Helarchaeota archaeon]